MRFTAEAQDGRRELHELLDLGVTRSPVVQAQRKTTEYYFIVFGPVPGYVQNFGPNTFCGQEVSFWELDQSVEDTGNWARHFVRDFQLPHDDHI